MEFSVHRLLVYALIAVAVLGVLSYLLLPFLFERNDPKEELLIVLGNAETKLGKAIESNEMFFAKREVLGTKVLESKERVVRFECFNQKLCCSINESCPKLVEWNSKRVSFNENKNISLFARCKQNFNLSVCVVSVGKPAQVEFLGFSVPETIDLKETNKTSLNGKIRNTGSINGVKVKAKAFLSKIVKENGKETKLLLKEETKEFEEILAGEEKEFTAHFFLGKKGKYEAVLRVEGENTGFDEKVFLLEVTDSRERTCSTAFADAKGQFSEEKQLCYKKFHCTGCEYGFQCKNVWEKKEPETAFELGSEKFALQYYPLVEGECG